MARTDTESLIFQMSADMARMSREMEKGRRESLAAMEAISKGNNKMVDKMRAEYAEAGRQFRQNFIARLEQASGPIGEVTAGAGGLAGALGIVAGGATLAATAMFTMARNAMETTGAIKDGADQARITTDTFQALNQTALQIGAEANTVGSAMAYMSTGMAAAEEETGRMFSALNKLNPALLEQFKNTTNNEERLRVVAQALRMARTENEQLNIVVGAFGRQAGPEMLRILKEAGYDIDGLIGKLKEQGRVLDTDLIAKADEAGDAYDVAMQRVQAATARAGAQFAPFASAGANAFAEIIEAANRATNELGAFIQRFERYTGLRDQLDKGAASQTNLELNRARADLERYIAAGNRVEISATRQRIASLERALGGGANQALDFPLNRNVTRPSAPAAPPALPPAPAAAGGGSTGGRGGARGIRSTGRPAIDEAARELDREIAELQRDGERMVDSVIRQMQDLARRAKDAARDQGRAESEGRLADMRSAGDRSRDAINRDLDAINRLGEMVSQFDQDAEDAARNLAEGLVSSALAGTAAFTDFADYALQQIARVVLQQTVIDPIANSIAGAFKGGNIGAILTRAFGGFRADGGPVSPSRSYVVGERGPELFLPQTPGVIVPAGGFGGAPVINITVEARGAVTQAEIEGRVAQGVAVGVQASRAQVPADFAKRAKFKRRR